MARVIIVLASTFLGALLGLLIGHLNLRALIDTTTPGSRVGGDMFLLSYLLAPILGTAIGFALSVATMRMFGPPKP